MNQIYQNTRVVPAIVIMLLFTALQQNPWHNTDIKEGLLLSWRACWTTRTTEKPQNHALLFSSKPLLKGDEKWPLFLFKILFNPNKWKNNLMYVESFTCHIFKLWGPLLSLWTVLRGSIIMTIVPWQKVHICTSILLSTLGIGPHLKSHLPVKYPSSSSLPH